MPIHKEIETRWMDCEDVLDSLVPFVETLAGMTVRVEMGVYRGE